MMFKTVKLMQVFAYEIWSRCFLVF